MKVEKGAYPQAGYSWTGAGLRPARVPALRAGTSFNGRRKVGDTMKALRLPDA